MKTQSIYPILLPTSEASEIYLNTTGILHTYKDNFGETPNFKPQHLYLCSTLSIKGGDWVYHTANKIIMKAVRKLTLEEVSEEENLKIEFTTDPKLIANGVPAIDGNTKAMDKTVIHSVLKKSLYEVNFLEEFCKRYNQKDNQKVDVEKLKEKDLKYYIRTKHNQDECKGFIDGYDQALQSNAGGFSLEDIQSLLDITERLEEKDYTANQIVMQLRIKLIEIQSLTKEQSNAGGFSESDLMKYYDERTEHWRQIAKSKIFLGSKIPFEDTSNEAHKRAVQSLTKEQSNAEIGKIPAYDTGLTAEETIMFKSIDEVVQALNPEQPKVVDVEKLVNDIFKTKMITKATCYTDNGSFYIDGLKALMSYAINEYQALQSNVGVFSLGDLSPDMLEPIIREYLDSNPIIREYFKSLTKEQPKGKGAGYPGYPENGEQPKEPLRMYVEMEEVDGISLGTSVTKIKLNPDGSPVIYFK